MITFRVNLLDYSVILRNKQPDNIENIINQLEQVTLWLPNVDKPVTHGSTITVTDRDGVSLQQQFANFLEIVEDVTLPTIFSAETDSTELVLKFREPVSGRTGFSLNGPITVEYVRGNETDTLVFAVAEPIRVGQVVTLDYVPGDITDDAGNALAAFSNFPVTNKSTNNSPVAAFSGTPLSGDAPLSVVFTDTSTNVPTSWHWEKNDGEGWIDFDGTPTGQSPTEEFAAGTWDVRLTATNMGGSDTHTETDYVTASAAVSIPAPVVYWKFDGDATDSSGNGADWSGAVTTAAGKFGDAYSEGFLDRTGDILEGVDVGTGPYTVAHWLKSDGGSFGILTVDAGKFQIAFGAAPNYIYTVVFNGAESLYREDPVGDDGGWHHAAVTVEDGTATLYIDGVSAASIAVTPGDTFAADDAWSLFNGGPVEMLDDLTFWDVALSPEQVAAIAAGTGPLSDLL